MMLLKLWFSITAFARLNLAFIDPIEVHGKHFFAKSSKEPFFIKGVDYQPGGSSGVCTERDPLSDPETCARDILLFQDLGINTIRIYSINPDLDHDICMTLLAVAGIYLVLDVNSPLEHQHLNRYEPWTTYNEYYASHVFKVIEEFSRYNNTMAFFAGNEIINDKKSAQNSPMYIKALVRDMKTYMKAHNLRQIPVGYSAADDLSYRTSLPNYLQCYAEDNPDTGIDFYGVNSYQWCGVQDMKTSGFDILVQDYSKFPKPVFFSEYGCNEVVPRQFQEIEYIYSTEMTDVFSGGLVYEFHQEDNNYGLVEYDSEGNVKLLKDYHTLKEIFKNLKAKYNDNVIKQNFQNNKNAKGKKLLFNTQSIISQDCESQYDNIVTQQSLPSVDSIEDVIHTGVSSVKGKYVPLKESNLKQDFLIVDINNKPYLQNEQIKIAKYPKGKKGSKAEYSTETEEKTNEKKSNKGIFSFLFKNNGK